MRSAGELKRGHMLERSSSNYMTRGVECKTSTEYQRPWLTLCYVITEISSESTQTESAYNMFPAKCKHIVDCSSVSHAG